MNKPPSPPPSPEDVLRRMLQTPPQPHSEGKKLVDASKQRIVRQKARTADGEARGERQKAREKKARK